MHNDWINDTIRHGLVKLLSIRLNGCPPDDMIELTARTWLEAVMDGRDWDRQRDEPRMQAAFVTIAKTRETWPAPKHFIDAIPPVPPAPAIGYERKPASPEAIERARREIEALGIGAVKPMPRATVERDTTPEQRERIEAELRTHYDAKRAAAGDDQ